MLLPNPQAQQWDSADASRLSDFLSSVTGQKLLSHLCMEAPEFDTGENPNVALVSAGRREGYELAVKTVLDLLVTQPESADLPVEKQSYPDLDNDKLWPKELQVDYVVPSLAPKPETESQPETPQS